MNLCHRIKETWLPRIDWLPALLTRVTVGWIFIEAGWGKLTHLDKVAEFFASLGIPAASIQAPFVAAVEFVGGILLVAGVATRTAAVPLIGTMVVAILTAKRQDIGGLSDLFAMPEFLLLILLTWLAVKGGGCVSAGRLFCRRECGGKTEAA